MDQILNIPQVRAENSLTRLNEAFANGEIELESDLLSHLTDEYVQLYSSLEEPKITPEPMKAKQLLRLSTLVNPMKQLDEDLSTGFSQVERLREAVATTQNVCTAERSGLNLLLSAAKDKIIEAKSWADDSDSAFLWVSDSLKTTTKVDPLSSAWVDTGLGLATLQVIGDESLAQYVSNIKVHHSSPDAKWVDGLPGNNLEVSGSSVTSMAETLEPVAPSFIGERQNSSTNLSSMFDGNPDTWFEWEKYLVPNIQSMIKLGTAYETDDSGTQKEIFGTKGVTKGYGWKYSIAWPGENDSQPATQMVVKPLVAAQTTAAAPQVVTQSAQSILNSRYNKRADNQFHTSPYSRETSISSSKIFDAIHNFKKTPVSNNVAGATGNEPLSLTMDLEFDSPRPLTWIQVLPYLTNKVRVFSLSSVLVSKDGTSDWIELLTSGAIKLNASIDMPVDEKRNGLPVKDYSGTAVVPCNTGDIKAIKLRFDQDSSYKTMIGHKFFVKTVVAQTHSSSWFGLVQSDSSSTSYVRTETTTLNETKKTGGSFLGWGGNTITSETELNTYYDIFSANRYAVGIRELGLYKRTYSQVSKLITKPLVFTAPVVAASVITSEIIPADWDTSKRWVRYEISSNGSDWQEVTPQNTGGVAGSVVHFPATKRLYLRVTLERPEDRPDESPVLEYYAIKATPEGTI